MAEDVAGAFNTSVTFTVLVIPPPVTVIADVLLPILAVAVFTLAVTIPLPEPDVGLTVNHDALSLAVQVPFDVTETDWFTGLAAPWTAENVSEEGLSVIVVDAGETVKVTGTDAVVVPTAVIVIVALYVPAVRAPVAAVTLTVPLPVPEVGPSVSQLALSLADQVRVPPPVLLMLSVCVTGLLSPGCAAKVRLAGLSPMAGFVGVGCSGAGVEEAAGTII